MGHTLPGALPTTHKSGGRFPGPWPSQACPQTSQAGAESQAGGKVPHRLPGPVCCPGQHLGQEPGHFCHPSTFMSLGMPTYSKCWDPHPRPPGISCPKLELPGRNKTREILDPPPPPIKPPAPAGHPLLPAPHLALNGRQGPCHTCRVPGGTCSLHPSESASLHS